MPYSVFLESRAEKDLKKLSREIRARIFSAILDLKHNPRPAGVKKLSAEGEYYRLRVGDWRAIYVLQQRTVTVIVISVGHRSEVYE